MFEQYLNFCKLFTCQIRHGTGWTENFSVLNFQVTLERVSRLVLGVTLQA